MKILSRNQSKDAQSTIEFSVVIVVICAGILLMGPYVIRGINAHMKGWEDAVYDSMTDPLQPVTQLPASPPPPGCILSCPDQYCCPGVENKTNCLKDCNECGDGYLCATDDCMNKDNPAQCCEDGWDHCGDGWCCAQDGYFQTSALTEDKTPKGNECQSDCEIEPPDPCLDHSLNNICDDGQGGRADCGESVQNSPNVCCDIWCPRGSTNCRNQDCIIYCPQNCDKCPYVGVGVNQNQCCSHPDCIWWVEWNPDDSDPSSCPLNHSYAGCISRRAPPSPLTSCTQYNSGDSETQGIECRCDVVISGLCSVCSNSFIDFNCLDKNEESCLLSRNIGATPCCKPCYLNGTTPPQFSFCIDTQRTCPPGTHAGP